MAAVEEFIILTGGPGSGKSTLLDGLRVRGFACMPEAGRAIIQEQVASNGTALPWADRHAFAQEMFRRDLQSWHDAHALPGPVFFDRGLPDTIGYLRLNGLAVPAAMDEATRRYRYHARVLIAPPWPAIFAQDAERKQSFAEAEATCRTMLDVYAEFGYDLIELPFASVAERLRFVLERFS